MNSEAYRDFGTNTPSIGLLARTYSPEEFATHWAHNLALRVSFNYFDSTQGFPGFENCDGTIQVTHLKRRQSPTDDTGSEPTHADEIVIRGLLTFEHVRGGGITGPHPTVMDAKTLRVVILGRHRSCRAVFLESAYDAFCIQHPELTQF